MGVDFRISQKVLKSRLNTSKHSLYIEEHISLVTTPKASSGHINSGENSHATCLYCSLFSSPCSFLSSLPCPLPSFYPSWTCEVSPPPPSSARGRQGAG